MSARRMTLRGLIAGLLISAAILGGIKVASGQGFGPGEGNPGPTTTQIEELTRGLPAPTPAALEPAALDAGGQAAIIAAELLLVPEEFFTNLPLVTR